MGSVLDIFPEPYRPTFKSDKEALADDWKKVGDDIRKVMKKEK